MIIKKFRNADAISPTVGVILMVGVTVLLAVAAGTLVFELNPSSTGDSEDAIVKGAVDISESDDGVSVQILSPSSDLDVKKNGKIIYTFENTSAGDEILITGYSEGDSITVLTNTSNPRVVTQEKTTKTVSKVDDGVSVISGGGEESTNTISRTVEVTDTSGTQLSTYPVKVVINGSDDVFTSGYDNGSDVRFTDENGDILYSWVEKFNTSNQKAVFWVNVTSVPASGTTNINMKYGDNTTVPEADAPNKTFTYYTDFNQTGNWVGNSNRAEVQPSKSRARLYEDTTSKEYMSNQMPIPENGKQFALNYDTQAIGSSYNSPFARTSVGVSNFTKEIKDISSGDSGTRVSPKPNPILSAYDGSRNYVSGSTSSSLFTEYHVTLTRNETEFNTTIRNGYDSAGSVRESLNKSQSNVGTLDRLMIVGLENQYSTSYTSEIIVPELWLREYAGSEPTVTVNSP